MKTLFVKCSQNDNCVANDSESRVGVTETKKAEYSKIFDTTNTAIITAVSPFPHEALELRRGRRVSPTHNELFRLPTSAGRFTGHSAPRARELLNNKLKRPTQTCTHAFLNQTCGQRRTLLCSFSFPSRLATAPPSTWRTEYAGATLPQKPSLCFRGYFFIVFFFQTCAFIRRSPLRSSNYNLNV